MTYLYVRGQIQVRQSNERSGIGDSGKIKKLEGRRDGGGWEEVGRKEGSRFWRNFNPLHSIPPRFLAFATPLAGKDDRRGREGC